MATREQPFSALSTTLSALVVMALLLTGFLSPVARLPVPGPIGTLHPEISDQPPRQASASGSTDNWTETEVVRGREECMHVLQSVAAEVEMLPPLKSGDCGVPAPVRLKSFGSSSKVVLDPPVEINCRLMAALVRWNKTVLQPAARNKLGSPVTRIVGASGYSCRNVYNLPDGNLSQHAFANAIDIAAFELKDGRSITVLKGWGPTARDIKAQAKAKADLARSKSPATAGGASTTTKPAPAISGKVLTRAGLSLGKPPAQKPETTALRPSAPVGGVEALKPTTATAFLTSLHQGACREFETVLGPEANEAHRNHFHFDLSPLRNQAYCE